MGQDIGTTIVRLTGSLSCSEFSMGGGGACASVVDRVLLVGTLLSRRVGFFLYLAAILRLLRSSLPKVAKVVRKM